MKNLIVACALSGFVTSCAMGHGNPPPTKSYESEMTEKHHGPHVVTVKSSADFEKTLIQLRAAIDSRGFKIFAVLDHAAGAASIGEVLRPTTLVIFGNPKGGTPLMQAEQKVGLELPLKILVTEDGQGMVQLTHPDMAHLFHEYGIAEMTVPLQKIKGALGAIAQDAGAR